VRLVVGDAERAQPHLHGIPDVIVAGAVRQAEIAPEQRDDRVIRDGAAVAQARGVQLEVAAVVEAVEELEEQA
jgi:hypothetical protein